MPFMQPPPMMPGAVPALPPDYAHLPEAQKVSYSSSFVVIALVTLF
jgi:hypothetical protein